MSDRHAECADCHGEISVPHGRRNITLDQVKLAHLYSCPATRKKQPQADIELVP